VVKGTRGNEDAERSGVYDEEEWTKDRALGDTAGGCVPGRQVSYIFDTEGRDEIYDLNQLRTEPWMPNQDERRVIKMSWSI